MALSGCGDDYQSSIPSVPFYFSCSLSQAPYYQITVPGQFLKVTQNVNGVAVGYAGLIIGQSVYSSGNQYIAFDAACPVEASRSVSLQLVSGDAFGQAECPKCKATFALSANGSRNDGKGTQVLRSYPVAVVGNTLQVRN
jgi:nitrite reductase/ring-hydroxylating ferredoxin subunit